ncbi:MAG: hypothetical protein E6G68_04315 [Actinobacteria bacterium]|nr:MAG: hypothetical protein E6G68_04315 [Actinomycetota bacterium]
MRFVRLAVAVSVLFLVVPPVSAAPVTRAVTIPGNYYSPQTIRIHVGDTVRWTNESSKNHTVTSNSDSAESFNSSANCQGAILFNDCIHRGRSFSHTFQTRGVFVYHCQLDGADAPFPDCGMCGRVIVVRKSSPTVAPSTPPSSSPTGSPSGSVSPSPFGSGTGSPGGSPSSGSSTLAGGKGSSNGSSTTIAIAAVGIALLATPPYHSRS